MGAERMSLPTKPDKKMTKSEISKAKALLSDRTQRTETVAVDGGGWALTAYWNDGGQKMFYSIEAVLDHIQYA
jgi:hypothetical protein